MKNNLFIFFLLLNVVAFSQKTYQKSYYESGEIKDEGWLVNNKKTDYWIFYYPNGNIKQKGHFKNNLKHKYWYFYHENSNKQKEGHFKNGLQNDWWAFFDKNGVLKNKCQLRDNEKNGYCLVYKNDKLVKASKFTKGKKVKEWTDFSSFKRENNLNDLR